MNTVCRFFLRLGGGAIWVVAGILIFSVGAGIGGTLGGVLASVGADARPPFCEMDRCSTTRLNWCEDAGEEKTNCDLHSFGCGTVPCGEAGSFTVLATFPTLESTDIWMAYGDQGGSALAGYALSREPYPQRERALETLARMAREWDLERGGYDVEERVSEVAVRFTRRPIEYVAPELRVQVLMRGIDLAVALEHPYHDESVRLLAHPDTVRARLGDNSLDYEAVVAYARNLSQEPQE